MNTSDERAVAQLAADLLSSANVSGIQQIALAGDDADLKLPAIVVSALFEEEARALKKNGNYGGRYRVEIELRALRTAPGTDALEAILAAIEAAMQATPNPLPPSAQAFSYYYIDARLALESHSGDETRDFKRSWSVFALLT
jgi:ABC-type branched-subunit amino acid transport system substrate-binding protein